jgi:hypothetical protein
VGYLQCAFYHVHARTTCRHRDCQAIGKCKFTPLKHKIKSGVRLFNGDGGDSTIQRWEGRGEPLWRACRLTAPSAGPSLRFLSRTTMLAAFPPELVERILDHLHDDSESLYSCATVHSTWTSVCRTHLFHTISIDQNPTGSESGRLVEERGSSPWQSLLGLLDGSPHLRPFVRVLHLCGICLNPNGRLAELFPRVHTLRVEDVLAFFPDLVFSFPELAHLCVSSCRGSSFGAAAPSEKCPLRTLDLIACGMSAQMMIMSFTLWRDVMGHLESASLDCDSADDIISVMMLCRLQQSLRSLTLRLGGYSNHPGRGADCHGFIRRWLISTQILTFGLRPLSRA